MMRVGVGCEWAVCGVAARMRGGEDDADARGQRQGSKDVVDAGDLRWAVGADAGQE